MFQELDDFLSQKDNFIDFILLEYPITILSNTVLAFSNIWYLKSTFNNIYSCDFISLIWLVLVICAKILELIPKIVIIYQTRRIKNSGDSMLCSRRLMNMTRSNLYYLNTKLGYLMIFLYTCYFLFKKASYGCKNNMKLYNNIKVLYWGFCFRIILSFVNYIYYFFLKENNTNNQDNEFYIDYQNRVSPDLLEQIPKYKLTKENIESFKLNDDKETEVCCICMNLFMVDEYIKILPCNNKHIFHQNCIEKWLKTKKTCPTCRTEVLLKIKGN